MSATSPRGTPDAAAHEHGRPDAHGVGHGNGHDGHGHGHSHGGVDPAILSSREAMRTLWLSLAVLGVTAAFQLVIILFSAAYAAYESILRLIEPSAPSHLFATAIAGAVGFVGNEWVAVYRIRSGKRIGSAALVADGYHARVDGFTSLAVVLGVAGVAVGFELADPIVGT